MTIAFAMLLIVQTATPAPAAPVQTITPPVPAATPDVTGMVTSYHDLTSVAPARCDSGATSDITVCGRRNSDQRLPLRDERASLAPSGQTGEDQARCVATGGGPCAVCPPTGCTGVNLLAVPFKLFKIAKALVAPDD